MNFQYDVAVLGGGPGGYVAAIRAAQLGGKTVLIEKDKLGGTCLNWGCIPTKALLHSAETYQTVLHAAANGVYASDVTFDYQVMVDRKNSIVSQMGNGIKTLVRQAGVTLLSGEGRLQDRHTILVNGEAVTAKSIILATGSEPARPPIQGIDSRGVLDSNSLLALGNCPETLLIIGGGVIGVEFATVFQSLGKQVTILEMMDSILPGIDQDVIQVMTRHLQKNGVQIITGAKVLSLQHDGDVICQYEKVGETKSIHAQTVLVAVGRKPVTSGIGLENVGLETQRGFMVVDEQMRTAIENIYAIGDITGQSQLAHVASAQGLVAAANATGNNKRISYDIIPVCIYSNPEIALIGLDEKQALAKGYRIKTGKCPASVNGKSKILGEAEGFVKIITDEKTGEILGAQIVGARATDMIAEIGVLMKAEGTVDELADTIHPHPTISEMVMEAAHDVEGLSCHISSRAKKGGLL